MHLEDDLDLATGSFINDPVIGRENQLGNCVTNSIGYDVEDFNDDFMRVGTPFEYSDDLVLDLFDDKTSSLLSGNDFQCSSSTSFVSDDEQSLFSDSSTSTTVNVCDDVDGFFDSLDLFNESSSNNDKFYPSAKYVKKYIQPILVSNSAVNVVQMTVVSPETSVQEVIKATDYKNTQQCFVMNGDNSQVFFLPLTSSNSFTEKGPNNDMPILTPEQPFTRKQLIEYRCNICQRLLSSKRTLTRHIRLHGSPKYKCGCCDRYFHDRSKLRRHYHSIHFKNNVNS